MRHAARLALAAVSLLILAGLAVAAILWFGSSSLLDSDQQRTDFRQRLGHEGTDRLGQTFVARHAGLTGIEFWLEPEDPGPLSFTLHLRSDPQSADDLAVASLKLPSGGGPGFHRFTFTPQADSHGWYYYAVLEADTGSALAATADGGAYLDGAAYLDDLPVDAQTAFRLVYSRSHIAVDLLLAGFRWLCILVAAGVLLILPGWGLLVTLWPESRLNWVSTGILSAGIGLAVYPVMFAWTHLLGLRLGWAHAALPALAGLGALAWHYRAWRPREILAVSRGWRHSDASWPDAVLAILLVLILGVRFLAIRTLDAPMWGDSYQHSLITQLVVDNGGLFSSWDPYAPLDSFTYHFGFHAFSSVFHCLTGTEVATSVLLAGQIVNGLAVLALYPLAVRLSKNRWAGVVAVLVAGLLSSMPMFYVNWGRYTQLAGQAILPVAVVIAWAALESKGRDWRLVGLSWIAISGLAMTHYRVLVWFVVFVAAWFLAKTRRHNWRTNLARVAALGTGSAALFLPWFAQAFAGRILRFFWQRLSTPVAQLSSFDLEHNTIGDLTAYLPTGIWLLFLLAAAIGLWRRRRGVLLVSLWWFLLFIVTNPERLGLPGSGIISNFTLFVAMYIPAGLLIGDLGCQLCVRFASRRWAIAAASLALAIVAVVAVPARLKDVQPDRHALVTRPDLRAMAWIEDNVPADSRFLVNSFLAYADTVVVGSDAGWWLPLLAHRPTTLPPINYSMESWSEPDYGEQARHLVTELVAVGLDSPLTQALLQEYGVTHVYVGQRQGTVNYGGPSTLDPLRLASSPLFAVEYYRDRVWVFSFTP